MLIFLASRSKDCELLATWYELNTGILHLCDTLDPTKVYVGLSVRTINPVHLVPTFIDINKCWQSSSHLPLYLVITVWESNRGDCLRFFIANFNSFGEDFGFWQVNSPCFTLWRCFKTGSPGFLIYVIWLRYEVTQCWQVLSLPFWAPPVPLHWIDLKLVVPRSKPILSQTMNSPFLLQVEFRCSLLQHWCDIGDLLWNLISQTFFLKSVFEF